MIEDLDGAVTGPSRAPFVWVVSVVLVLAVIIGWAALQSPALRGPYATPDPRRAVLSPRPDPAVAIAVDPAALRLTPASAVSSFGCFQIQQIRTATAFVGDHPVTIERALTSPPPGVETSTVITVSGPRLMWSTCLPDSRLPSWRLAP